MSEFLDLPAGAFSDHNTGLLTPTRQVPLAAVRRALTQGDKGFSPLPSPANSQAMYSPSASGWSSRSQSRSSSKPSTPRAGSAASSQAQVHDPYSPYPKPRPQLLTNPAPDGWLIFDAIFERLPVGRGMNCLGIAIVEDFVKEEIYIKDVLPAAKLVSTKIFQPMIKGFSSKAIALDRILTNDLILDFHRIPESSLPPVSPSRAQSDLLQLQLLLRNMQLRSTKIDVTQLSDASLYPVGCFVHLVLARKLSPPVVSAIVAADNNEPELTSSYSKKLIYAEVNTLLLPNGIKLGVAPKSEDKNVEQRRQNIVDLEARNKERRDLLKALDEEQKHIDKLIADVRLAIKSFQSAG